MSTLMISGFFTLVVEGVPPQISAPALLVIYTASIAIGFCSLFGSLFVTMKYQSRMSDYNIYNVKQVYSCGDRHEAFESYYECHCSIPAKIATLLFYCGTIVLVYATMVLQFAKWFYSYANLTAAIVYVVVCGVGCVGLLGINFFVQTKTRALNTPSDAQAAEEDARQMDRGQMGDVPIRRVLSTGSVVRDYKVKQKKQQRVMLFSEIVCVLFAAQVQFASSQERSHRVVGSSRETSFRSVERCISRTKKLNFLKKGI
jgi:uncharacterized membrane protein SirB2